MFNIVSSMKRKRFENFTKEELWQLRKEIKLNSLFVSDYRNTFGISERSVCDFFDGYMEYLSEVAWENAGGGDVEVSLEEVFEYDSAAHLWDWFHCFDDFTWIEFER